MSLGVKASKWRKQKGMRNTPVRTSFTSVLSLSSLALPLLGELARGKFIIPAHSIDRKA